MRKNFKQDGKLIFMPLKDFLIWLDNSKIEKINLKKKA